MKMEVVLPKRLLPQPLAFFSSDHQLPKHDGVFDQSYQIDISCTLVLDM